MASVVIGTIIGVVYTVIVAFIFFMLGLRASRPNLIRGGSSTESVRIPNKDVMVTSVTIQNNPSLLGMKIDREPARIVSAQIYHPSLTRIFGPNLVWQKEMSREPSAPGAECIIEEWKSRSLYLFEKERFSEEYFMYAPTDNSADLLDRLIKFKDEERKFSLVLRDHIG